MSESKTVYQTDRSGYLVGPVVADESPLEPGVFLIPAGCVEEAPPAEVEGKRRRWTEAAWALENIPEPEPEPAPEPEPPFAARLAARRYQAETAGTTWNGWRVHTDRDARANLHAEYTAASDGTRADGEYWKFADGIFRALTNAQIMEMTLAVREHVKACFAVEAQKLAAQAAGEPVDIEAGWPV